MLNFFLREKRQGLEKNPKTIANTRLNPENMLESSREVVIMEQPWES